MAKYALPVKCPECGNEAHSGAVTCGKCGFPLKRGKVNTVRVVTASVAPELEELNPFEAISNFSLWGGFVNVLKNFVEFDGRARRKEFWGWVLFGSVFVLCIYVLVAIVRTITYSWNVLVWEWVGVFISVATFLPYLAVSVRRMHDTDNSGWWAIIPGIVFIFACVDGTPGDNKYGPDPKGREVTLD